MKNLFEIIGGALARWQTRDRNEKMNIQCCVQPWSDKYVYYYIMQRQTFKYTYPYILLVLPILPVCLRFRMTKQTSKQINQTKPANNKHRERSRWFCFATPTSARSNHVLWAANLLNTSTTTMASTGEEQTVVAPQLNTKDVTLFTFHMAPSLCFPATNIFFFVFAYSSHTLLLAATDVHGVGVNWA